MHCYFDWETLRDMTHVLRHTNRASLLSSVGIFRRYSYIPYMIFTSLTVSFWSRKRQTHLISMNIVDITVFFIL